jgi:hypothetical protein
MLFTQRSLIRLVVLTVAVILAAGVLPASVPAIRAQSSPSTLDWPFFRNDLANVAQLQPAWIFHTGILDDRAPFSTRPRRMICSSNPVIGATRRSPVAQTLSFQRRIPAPLTLVCAVVRRSRRTCNHLTYYRVRGGSSYDSLHFTSITTRQAGDPNPQGPHRCLGDGTGRCARPCDDWG